MLIKVLSTEAAITAANNVALGKVVRLVETGTGNALITRARADTTVIGTFTMRQGSEAFVVKDPTDTLTSNAASVLAVSVAFQN